MSYAQWIALWSYDLIHALAASSAVLCGMYSFIALRNDCTDGLNLYCGNVYYFVRKVTGLTKKEALHKCLHRLR